MNRKTVNSIRWILEDVIPPFVRDSRFFYLLLFLVFKGRTSYYAEFRQRSPYLSLEEYAEYYKNFPHIMGETDLNKKCIDKILKDTLGSTILDAGCGRGFLARKIFEADRRREVSGLDVELSSELLSHKEIKFNQGFVERMPFSDNAFDTVVCTHTLEHVLNFETCLQELRRVASKRLIIVVPQEREYKYAFNLHLHFFPYKHSFLNRVNTHLASSYICEILDGDIYYCENLMK